MRLRNSSTSYGSIAQLFHWLIALLVFAQIAIGLYAADLPVSIERLKWLSRHKSIGITVLALVLLRFAWRVANTVPALPASMPRRERVLAIATHRLLYLLLVLAPLSGWLHASAAGLSASWFGVFTVPDMVAKNPGITPYFEYLHEVFVYSLIVLLALHIGAALRHALFLRDGVMKRMLPGSEEQ